MDKELGQQCYNKGKSKEIVRCPSPSGQNSVFNDPSWLDQILNAEEEELEEILAATLSSGTAYYASTPGSSSSSSNSTYRPSVNSTTSSISAPPASSDHNVVSDPNSVVRIIKPLPKRDLKSRFPNAVRIIKPLPRKPLRSRFSGAIRVIKPLPKRIWKVTSFSDPKTQSSSISMEVDNHTSSPNQPDSDAMECQPSWQQEVDDYAMNEDESHTGLPTSIVFRGLKDGSAERSTEPTVYGSLFKQADPWDTIGQILGLSNTKPSKSPGEMMDELEELDESEEWLRIRSAIAANMIGTNDTLSTGTQHQHSFQPDYSGMQDTAADNRLHHESSSPLMRSPSDNESGPSLDSIPTGQSSTTNVLQMPVYPDNSDDKLDENNESLDDDDFDDESLDEAQIGDDDERDTGIHNAAIPTGFIAGRSTSPESDPNNSVTVNDSTSLTEPSRSTSVSIVEPSHSAPGHGATPSPNGQGSTSASHLKPSGSAPANDIDTSIGQKQTTADSDPKRFDSASVANSNSSSKPAQSESTTSSVPAIIVTHCANSFRSPLIHTSLAPSSGQFLSALAPPGSPVLPSMLQPAALNTSDVPAQADAVLMCPAYTAIDTQALGAINFTAVTAPQPYTTHVFSAFYQDKPELMHVDTQDMSFESLAPSAELYAQIPCEPSDTDMCLDTSPNPSYFPDYYPTPTPSDEPEMWWSPDMQQDPNEDDDPKDLMDFDDPMTSRSDLYEQFYQAHPETAFSSDWCYAEVTEDVDMGNAILAESEVAHDDRCPSTPMTCLVIMEDPDSYVGEEGEPTTLSSTVIDSSSGLSADPPMPDIAIALEALVDAPITTETQSLTVETPSYQTRTEVPKTQGEVMELVSPQPRTTKTRNVPTSMTIPSLHPTLLMGDISAFMQQISTIVNTLDSFTSLKLEAQDFGAIQTTATQLVSAANWQPTPHGRVLQSPEPKTPVDEPPTAERSADAPDRDEFRSVGRNSVKKAARPEDIDTNVYPTRLPDCGGAELYVPSRSTPNRGLTRYGRWPMVNNSPLTILPSNGREMQTLDLDETAIDPMLFSDSTSEDDFTRTTTVSSKARSKNVNRSATEVRPSRTRRRLRIAVDIANTWLTLETEPSGTRCQSSASSTALCVEIFSHMESIPKKSTSTTLQPDKAVKTQSFWDNLWETLTSLI